MVEPHHPTETYAQEFRPMHGIPITSGVISVLAYVRGTRKLVVTFHTPSQLTTGRINPKSRKDRLQLSVLQKDDVCWLR